MARLLSAAALLALVACAPLSLVACAAAPPPAASPEPPPPGFYAAGPREPSPVDREMVAIGHAEEEIDRLFPEANAPAGPGRGPGKAAPRSPTTPDKPAEREAKDAGGKEEPRAPAGGLTGDRCAVACKALASMVSSAEHLCQLSGENDGRCDDARARVRGAGARVKSSCPGCTVSTAPAATPKGTPAPEPPKGPAPGMPGTSSGIPIP